MTKQKEILTDSAPMELSPMLVAGVQGAAVDFIEFFAASAEISEEAQKHGMTTFTIDWKQWGKIDLVKDVEKIELSDIPLPRKAGWFAPDCTTYTISAISHHRNGTEPKSEYAKKCDKVNQHFIGLIDQILAINPNFIFFIENPRGMMRHMPWIKRFTRYTVWYCQYGDERAKPTDIWTNSANWIPRPMCRNYKYDEQGKIIERHCHHASARRGAKTGTQGRNGSYERSKMPKELINEIIKSVLAVEAVAP
jgi:hypothetical protein